MYRVLRYLWLPLLIVALLVPFFLWRWHRFFAQPWFLILVVMVPFIVWRWLNRPRTALRFSDTALFATLPPGRSHWAHRLGIFMRAGALLAIVLALAGPRWPDRSTRIPTDGIAIMMVVDSSGSMGEQDFQWPGAAQPISRLEAVRRAFRLFVDGGETPDGEQLDGRRDDLIGLIPFARRPDTDECPLTLSHSVLLRVMDEMQPRTIADELLGGGTNISDAVMLAAKRLHAENPRQRKVMILLSDGEHNVDKPVSEASCLQAAQLAGQFGITIYTIDAGGEAEAGADPTVDQRAGGIQTLKDIAEITQGQYFQARDGKTLVEVCRRIDGLTKEKIESYQYRRYYEAFPWLGLLAFTLWTTVTMLELTKWQRLP